MAKETKEERNARLAVERVDAEIAENAKEALYRKSLPKRMLEVQALAQVVGLPTSVSLIESGPEISIRFPYSDKKEGSYGVEINYDTEEWEMENVERNLQELKEEFESKLSRRAVAQAIWTKLTTVEQVALKENIYSLR